MRLFIALGLPPAFLVLLKEAGEALGADAQKISLTRAENLHLTLRFLGEVPQEHLPALSRLILGLGGHAVRGTISGYGSFPAPEGLTLWAGIEGGAPLSALAAQVGKGLGALGFAPEGRPFVPHVTLARRARLKKPLAELLPLLPLHPAPLLLGPLTLFESRLGPGGPRYSAVASG